MDYPFVSVHGNLRVRGRDERTGCSETFIGHERGLARLQVHCGHPVEVETVVSRRVAGPGRL